MGYIVTCGNYANHATQQTRPGSRFEVCSSIHDTSFLPSCSCTRASGCRRVATRAQARADGLAGRALAGARRHRHRLEVGGTHGAKQSTRRARHRARCRGRCQWRNCSTASPMFMARRAFLRMPGLHTTSGRRYMLPLPVQAGAR
jgi:hypothetical protein